MKAEDIKTLDDLCNYIEEYADVIFVREQVPDHSGQKNRWESISLADLPSRLAIKHALRFIKEKRIPTRLLREGEKE